MHAWQVGAALLAKMRTGSQTLSDLEDPHALWGYVNAVGAKRAYNVCETFGWLWAHDLGAVLRTERSRSLCVASVGGGPGCCLLGWAVFERLTLAAAAGSADVSGTHHQMIHLHKSRRRPWRRHPPTEASPTAPSTPCGRRRRART